MTSARALEGATRLSAHVLAIAASVGTVEPGKVADLVLLDADPLADSRNTRRIAAAVVRGRAFERPGLDEVLAAALRAPHLRTNDWLR